MTCDIVAADRINVDHSLRMAFAESWRWTTFDVTGGSPCGRGAA